MPGTQMTDITRNFIYALFPTNNGFRRQQQQSTELILNLIQQDQFYHHLFTLVLKSPNFSMKIMTSDDLRDLCRYDPTTNQISFTIPMVANAEQDIPLPQLKRQLVGAFYLAFWEIMTNPLYNKSTANSSAQATLDKPFFPKTHEDMDTFVNAIKTGIRRVTSYNTFRYRKLFPNSPVVVRLQKINKKLDQYTPPHYFHQFSGEDAAKIHVAITKNKQIIRFYSQDLHLYLYLSCAYPLNQSNTVFSGASIEPKDHNLFALIDEIFLIEEFLSELDNAALSRRIEQLKAIIAQIIQIDTTVLRLFFPELCAIHLCGGMINYAEDSGDNLNIKIATGDPWADIHINKLRIISSPPTGLTCEDLLTQEELNDESEEELKNNPNKTPALAPLLKILLCALYNPLAIADNHMSDKNSSPLVHPSKSTDPYAYTAVLIMSTVVLATIIYQLNAFFNKTDTSQDRKKSLTHFNNVSHSNSMSDSSSNAPTGLTQPAMPR